MNRTSLARAVTQHSYLTHDTIRHVLDVALDLMAGAIARGETIELRGFGRFRVSHRKARRGFGFGNTQGRLVDIPARRVVRFRAHDVVLRALATGEEPPVTPIPDLPGA